QAVLQVAGRVSGGACTGCATFSSRFRTYGAIRRLRIVRSNLEPSIERHGAIHGGDRCRRKVLPPPEPACPSPSATKRVLGGVFHFESDSHDLIGLVEAAYG